MKNMKKMLVCIVVLLLFVTACGKVPQLKNGSEAVVTSKKGDISADDLYKEMKENYALNTLINMYDMQVLEKLYPTDEEEKNSIASQKEQLKYNYENSYYVSYYKTFDQFLMAYYGVSDIKAAEEIMSLEYKRGLVTDEYAKGLVTDKEIQKYYDDEVIGDIKASHILIKANFEEGATDDEKEEAYNNALKKAKEVVTKLKNGGKFADLAKEYSEDGSKDDGGNLGWFNKGDMVSEFEKAAIELEKDKYTEEPVKTEYGYHIILKTDSKAKPKLKEVKEDVVETLIANKKEADENIQNKALKKLREDNKMKIHDDKLKKQYKNYLENLGL